MSLGWPNDRVHVMDEDLGKNDENSTAAWYRFRDKVRTQHLLTRVGISYREHAEAESILQRIRAWNAQE